MRGWATFPAGLRYPPLVPSASCDALGQRKSNLGLHTFSSCSLTHSRVRHNRCESHTPRSLKREPRRTFTASSRSQIIIIDEEEDEPVTPFPQHASMRLGVARIAPRDMNDLIRARGMRAKQRLTRPLDPKKLREIERKAGALDRISTLVNEYLETKYAPVEHHLSQSAKAVEILTVEYKQRLSVAISHHEHLVRKSQGACQFLEHQYCKIVFRDIPYLRTRVAKTARVLGDLHLSFIRLSLRILKEESDLLRGQLNEQFLIPRDAARAKIDRALERTDLAAQQYVELQGKVAETLNGLNSLRPILASLALSDSPFSARYQEFLDKHHVQTNDLSGAGHAYRWSWRKSRRSETELGEAYQLEFFTLIHFSQLGGINPPDYVWSIMFEDARSQRIRAYRHKHNLQIIDRIRRAYLQRWKGPRPSWSPELSNYWRQLDVIAPFDIQRMHQMLLKNEVLYLIATTMGTFGPMWEGLQETQHKSLRNRLVDWHKSYRECTKEFLIELESYRYISWYRFGLEKRMMMLRVPNIIQAEGLFVPEKPMSQQLGRFYRWIHQMMDLRDRAYTAESAVRLSKQLNITDTWSAMTERYKLEAAARKSQILDLGSVRVRRRGVSRKNARASRQTRFKSPRRKLKPIVRSKPGSDLRSTMPANNVTVKVDETKARRTTVSNQRRKSKKRAQAPISPRSQEQAISASKKRKPSTSTVEPHKQADKTEQGALPSDTKTRVKKPKNGEDEHDARRTSEKSKTDKIRRPSDFKTKDSQNTKDQSALPRKSDGVSKGKPLRLRKSSPQRNFWEPNPITIPGGLNPKSGDRPYSTSSRLYRDSKLSVMGEQKACTLESHSLVEPIKSVTNGSPDNVETSTVPMEQNALFWTHSDQLSPNGRKPVVHYCKSRESTERISQHFLDSKVIGFDLEWQAQSSASSSIQNNLSLIQIADETRIALFQIALFRPSRSREDLIAPTLKRILESPDITKVGVSIKADSTRLRKYLGIETRAIFELSHLHKLIQYGQSQPALVNKRLVNLSEQVHAHLGLPLDKSGDVRCSNWTIPLNHSQVNYAATDPYASICLFHTMERKRLGMKPTPPRPAFAELNLPIIRPAGQTVNVEDHDLVSGLIDGDFIDRSS
ncbi:Uncharacterized protein PECM_002376 [Penicillium ucsense]|uniref:3'-5' exonuclease domain-containing protein n=1 Tax=Penicillium ucsense TaxID=2839758 RepID=A0A8J8WL98_9EURO|nr:Uncharacterized protein PECM_002376 [Penicillium ucsense]